MTLYLSHGKSGMCHLCIVPFAINFFPEFTLTQGFIWSEEYGDSPHLMLIFFPSLEFLQYTQRIVLKYWNMSHILLLKNQHIDNPTTNTC